MWYAVTDNLFGDMLSDVAAMLTGSLGMLPSASLGKASNGIFTNALYEPVHGSAPDIEGQGIANPLASILSFAMALRYSFSRIDDANLLEKAISNVLEAGLRTKDISTNDSKVISDYAHTPDALKTLLTNIKDQFPFGKIRLVFGCGGDRDKEKRSIMGKIAARYADIIYLYCTGLTAFLYFFL